MLTSKQCYAMFGDPKTERHLLLWIIPADIRGMMPALPKRIYCNKHMPQPLEKALRNLIKAGCQGELKTWDGCFNIRSKKGARSMSLHSWAVAIDLNAAWNAFGAKPTLSAKFVKCFTDAGFDWGGAWSKPDGMHFQLHDI